MADKIINELLNPENWKPNFTKIAEKSGKTYMTASSRYDNIKDIIEVSITIRGKQ